MLACVAVATAEGDEEDRRDDEGKRFGDDYRHPHAVYAIENEGQEKHRPALENDGSEEGYDGGDHSVIQGGEEGRAKDIKARYDIMYRKENKASASEGEELLATV